MRQHTTLTRDCEAAEIPYGGKVQLTAGTVVTITQALGGSYTVLTPNGYMVRIAGKDADALGEDFAAEAAKHSVAAEGKTVEQMAWEQLRTCYDPEIPINIVDLGLIYECTVSAGADGKRVIHVRLTLTAPGCGMGDVLVQDIKQKLEIIPTVESADVELVFDPPWNQSMMTEAARLQTGMF